MNEHIFEASKIYENISDASSLLLKRVYIFRRVVYILDSSSKFPTIFQCYYRRVVHISDASRKTLNYSRIFPRRVENVPTRRRNMLLYFNVILDASCKFATRQIYIYDPSARIIKNILNSTVFWKRHHNPATLRLNSATRPLNSATRQILH